MHMTEMNKANDPPMTQPPTASSRMTLVFWLSFAGVLAIILGKVAILAPEIHRNVVLLDNDSVMRLHMVQNWLGGQGWFDTTAYRLVPPEGVLMHWSRYIDAAIGGLMVVFSWVLPAALAQTAALVAWPTLLAIALVLIIGLGTRRLIGPEAACFAMLLAVVWPYTSNFYFLAGLIDHHNVQVLMIVLITFAIIWPDQPMRSGIVAGIAAAFALAIGLETLPYILLVGGLLFLRANLAVTPVADRLLAVFCVAFCVSAVIFWLGQTPPALWGAPVCDQLGLPVLSLIAIASVASILPMLIWRDRLVLRLGLGVLLVALGCALAWPLLGPCLAGPYGSLPPEVAEIIRSGIIEAKPALQYAKSNIATYIKMALPVMGSLVLAAYFWRQLPKTTPQEQQRRDIIGQLMILSLVGILASFSQIRLLLMSAAAVPVLTGFVLAIFLRRYLATRAPNDAIVLLATATILVAPVVLEAPIKRLLPKEPPALTAQDTSCRDMAALTPLNEIAPAIFLTPMNLGPVLILATHHSSLSGPYHRSPAAFANGYLPFNMPQDAFKAYIADTNATHLLLCGGTTYGVGFARELVEGATADWLTPVAVEAGDLMVFEIN